MANLNVAPVLRLSHSTLANNLRAILASQKPGDTAAVLDLRRDACGLDADRIREAVRLVPGIDVLTDHERVDDTNDGNPATLLPLAAALFSPDPALSLVGSVLALKSLAAGEGVSYGYRYRAPLATTLALLTGGYAQGIVRSLGGQVSVNIAGERCQIVGAVAMDVCMADIGDAAVSVGDEVEFFGNAVGISPWTAATGLQVDELVAAIGLHLQTEHQR